MARDLSLQALESQAVRWLGFVRCCPPGVLPLPLASWRHLGDGVRGGLADGDNLRAPRRRSPTCGFAGDAGLTPSLACKERLDSLISNRWHDLQSSCFRILQRRVVAL